MVPINNVKAIEAFADSGRRITDVERLRHQYNQLDARHWALQHAVADGTVSLAPVAMSVVGKRKAADLAFRGYTVVGYTMTKPGDRTAVLIDAAVRWLTPEQQHTLMFVEDAVIAPRPMVWKAKDVDGNCDVVLVADFRGALGAST